MVPPILEIFSKVVLLRGPVGRALVAICLSAALIACQPAQVTFRETPERATLGELVYAISLDNARHQNLCSSEFQEVLIDDREVIVSAVDEVFTEPIIDDLPFFAVGAVLPAADEGQLARLEVGLVASLSTLVDNGLDPDREGLAALAEVLNSNRGFQDQHILELMRVVLPSTEFSAALHSLASMGAVADPLVPSRSLLGSAMLALSQLLSSQAWTGTPPFMSHCTGLEPGRAAQRLLETDAFASAYVVGDAAWVAYVDASGDPQLAQGASSSSSELAPFGFGEHYDGDGRRTNPDGTLAFRYYDATHTALARWLKLAGEAAGAGVVFDAARVFAASMGESHPCEDLSGPCYSYSLDAAGMHRLLFTLLEVARYESPQLLLKTWRDLVSENPRLAEEVLVTVGRIIKALQEAAIELDGTSLVSLTQKLLPVIADVMQIRGDRGVAMPRLLMQLVRDLGASSREFPEKLALNIEHTSLLKAEQCSISPPSPLSPKVDYARRRYFYSQGSLVDNRSALERSIELLDAANCGSVPLTGGKTVSHVIVDLMSRLAPETVCTLIDTLLGLLGGSGSLGEVAVDSALFVLGCREDGDVSARDLFTLDDLAKSGALDFYLPVAKSFREEAQLPALIAVFSVLAHDLRSDEDSSANTSSALRPILSVLAQVMRSGAMDAFFDLNDALVSAPASAGPGTMADVVVDSAQRLFEDRGRILTAAGVARTSLASELLGALREVLVRVDNASAGLALQRVVRHTTSYLTRTTTQGGSLRLADPSVVPLLANSLEFLSDLVDLPSEQYQCYLGEYHQRLRSWIQSPTLASVLRVATEADSRGLSPGLANLAVALLTAERSDVAIAPYREILRMSAELLQAPQQARGGQSLVQSLAQSLARALDPDRVGTDVVVALASLLEHDDKRVLGRIVSAALGPANTPASEAPGAQIADAWARYRAIDKDNACMASEVGGDYTVAELESFIQKSIGALGSPESVLNTFLKLLERRRRE